MAPFLFSLWRAVNAEIFEWPIKFEFDNLIFRFTHRRCKFPFHHFSTFLLHSFSLVGWCEHWAHFASRIPFFRFFFFVLLSPVPVQRNNTQRTHITQLAKCKMHKLRYTYTPWKRHYTSIGKKRNRVLYIMNIYKLKNLLGNSVCGGHGVEWKMRSRTN